MVVIHAGSPDVGTGPRPLRQRSGHGGGRYRGPGPSRPGGAPARYRGTGVAMSVAPHARRPVSVTTTVALALLTAVITVWLGLLAHFSAVVAGDSDASPAVVPDRLAVVQTQPGETLEHLAARVAPDAPAWQVVGRIRELNKLDSSTLVASQALIVPVG